MQNAMQLMLILYVCYLTNIPINYAVGINLWKKYNELRKKISKALNKGQGSELLLDVDEYEYPGANETLRKIHEESWQDYYDCLTRTFNEIGPQRTMYPVAVEALEGTLVTLDCQICVSPAETYMSDDIDWYFNGTATSETNKLVEESDNTFVSPIDRTLMIYSIKSGQAGRYWCQLGDLSSVSYHVSIDTDLDGVKIVHPRTAPNMAHHATMPKALPEYNLNVYTTWTKWSKCSRCGVVGKKTRYGYCTISSLEKNAESKRRAEEEEQTEAAAESRAVDESAGDRIKAVLRLFKNSVPCKSKYLPKKVLSLTDIKNRKTEMMVRYCKIKCPENVIFEIRDKKGNVIESANNSAGVYSMVQGMPEPSPPVVRTTIYQKRDKKATLACPGSLNTDIPITWKVDDKILNPTVIKEQSEGRIYINAQMHVVFKSLKFEDANIYSCWQKNEIVGVIKLSVTGEIELQTNQSVIIVGGILIIVVFLIVFWRAFLGRKRFTIH